MGQKEKLVDKKILEIRSFLSRADISLLV